MNPESRVRLTVLGVLVTTLAGLAWWLQESGRSDQVVGQAAEAMHAPEDELATVVAAPAVEQQALVSAAPEVEQPAAEAPVWPLLLHAIDARTELGLADAEFLISQDSQPLVSAGFSDEAGVLAWDVQQPGRWLVSGRTPERVAAPVPVDLAAHAAGSVVEVRLRFEPARTVVGSLSWADGVPVDEPAVIYAWPPGHAPSAAAIRARQPVHPPASSAPVAAGGSFVLHGLPEAGRVAVVPALDGAWLPEHRHPYLTLSDAPIQLTVERLFGVLVELVEPGGAALVAPPGSYGMAGARLHLNDPRLADRNASLDGWAAALAGLDAELLEVDGWLRRVLVVSGPQAESLVGPLPFRVDIPGHAPGETDVMLARLDRPLRVQQLALDPLMNGVGELLIALRGDPAVWARGGLSRPVAVFSVYGTSGAFEVPVQVVPDDGRVLVTDFPAGRHEVSWRWTNPLAPEQAPTTVVVSPGGRATWELPADGIGALELSARLGSGRVSGLASFHLRVAGSTSRHGFMTFSDEPYLVPGLPSGPYEVRLDRPATSEASSAWTPAEVASGVRTPVELGGP